MVEQWFCKPQTQVRFSRRAQNTYFLIKYQDYAQIAQLVEHPLGKGKVLDSSSNLGSKTETFWRVGRVVYGASFENWWAKVLMGSNPIPSAKILLNLFSDQN